MNEKTQKRKRLEELEDDIHKSWLHDLDKVREIVEIKEILDQILISDSIESYFNNIQSDIDYFLKKFSNEIISNILRQHYIYGEKGDDLALEVLKNYLRLYIKYVDKPQYLALFENLKEIFDPSKSYYRGMSYGNVRVQNDTKLMSNERFNVNLF